MSEGERKQKQMRLTLEEKKGEIREKVVKRVKERKKKREGLMGEIISSAAEESERPKQQKLVRREKKEGVELRVTKKGGK